MVLKWKTFLICFFFVIPSVHATEIKFAILAPEGSTWANATHEWDAELRQKSNGRLGLKIYSGGVLGDEQDVIRKLRIGQVQAAAFTGLGLGIINPNVRVLELPFLFENYREVDEVARKIQPKLEGGFSKNGFVLLGWTETGFVNIFSNKPITSRKSMNGMRMWAWEGDAMVENLYRVFKITPVPLALPDVLTSLQTKLIDAVYAPPLGAVALQWFTRTKYMTTTNIGYSIGGILISQRALATLSPTDQQILKETAKRYARKVIEQLRVDNDKSYATLKNAGLQFVELDPQEIDQLKETGRQVWTNLSGKLYPPALLDEVKGYLAEARTTP
ncbi:MAG: TRAP transporter substrate-binding protein DctP [Deltaproteobacteria bacterium]|nr:TRAP transporter substrate-binding protein DctP [Deltaproteobacteria bacterium]